MASRPLIVTSPVVLPATMTDIPAVAAKNSRLLCFILQFSRRWPQNEPGDCTRPTLKANGKLTNADQTHCSQDAFGGIDPDRCRPVPLPIRKQFERLAGCRRGNWESQKAMSLECRPKDEARGTHFGQCFGKRVAEPISAEILIGSHRVLMKGRTDLAEIGSERTGAEPMQVVSGAFFAPKVHFEACPVRVCPTRWRGLLTGSTRPRRAGNAPCPPWRGRVACHPARYALASVDECTSRAGAIEAIGQTAAAIESPIPPRVDQRPRKRCPLFLAIDALVLTRHVPRLDFRRMFRRR